MKRYLVIGLLLASVSSFAKTHHDMFNIPCTELWPAVKDTLRNSGKYGVIGIDNAEMTASYNIGGYLGGKRINALILNSKGNTCELQIQTSYSGMTHDDAGDFKDRVEKSLQSLKEAKGTAPAAATPSGGAPATEAAAPQAEKVNSAPKP
jgi:hypothetical protein